MSLRRSRDDSDLLQEDAQPPGKTRRISRACNQCRNRKQRCDGQSSVEPSAPCQRCCQLGFTCSFTTTPLENEIENSAIAIKKVGKIQKQLLDHQKRIEELEEALRDFRKANHSPKPTTSQLQNSIKSNEYVHGNGTGYNEPSPELAGSAEPSLNLISSPTNPQLQGIMHPTAEAPNFCNTAPLSHATVDTSFTMDAVDLDTPMSTLRNIASLSKYTVPESYNMTYDPIFPIITKEERQAFEQDPVAQGLLTMEEAQEAFDVFFSNCHPMAPFLCIQTQRSAAYVHQSSPALFLSVCAVGTRFWHTSNNVANCQGLHRNYRAIIALLDASMSRLLLQPNLSDVSLDHIRCLLLYIQWMPVEQNASGISQTRYNDISAWSVLGLAIRYSLFLGLDRTAIAPFASQSTITPSQEDFSRLRVWVNVLTCDCHLMLSAGLPASLDPEPVTKVGRTFAFHPNALPIDDARIAAISELVAIIKKAARSSGDPRVRVLDAMSLKRANAEFDNWEVFWAPELTKNKCQHSQMPFTSLRWYRLALNSAGLGSILARNKQHHGPMQLPLLQSLDTSLLSAAQFIFALSNETSTQTWSMQSQSLESFPQGPFTVNDTALGRFRFSVDSSWIAHSFAAVFLVLCYTRGAIDDELRIRHLLQHSESNLEYTPPSPRPDSLFYRLISLASQIFDTICRTSATTHPAADYRSIINNVFSVILKDKSQTSGQLDHPIHGDEMGIEMDADALFELMFNGSGFNWPSVGFRDDGTEIGTF